MFLELKEIAHCFQWKKKKVIEEKDEGEREETFTSPRVVALTFLTLPFVH